MHAELNTLISIFVGLFPEASSLISSNLQYPLPRNNSQFLQNSIRIPTDYFSNAQQVAYVEFVTLVHRTQQLVRNPLLLNWTQERSRADPIVQRIFDILANQKSSSI